MISPNLPFQMYRIYLSQFLDHLELFFLKNLAKQELLGLAGSFVKIWKRHCILSAKDKSQNIMDRRRAV